MLSSSDLFAAFSMACFESDCSEVHKKLLELRLTSDDTSRMITTPESSDWKEKESAKEELRGPRGWPIYRFFLSRPLAYLKGGVGRKAASTFVSLSPTSVQTKHSTQKFSFFSQHKKLFFLLF